MNINQILSFVRALLNLAGGTVVAKGYSDSSTWETIAGGVLALISVVWSYYHHADPPTTTPPTPPAK